MRVKSFRAADLAEAMRQVRHEMGDDAIILASSDGKDGAEVIAAIDGEIAAEQATPERPKLDMRSVAQSLAFHGLPERIVAYVCRRMSAANPATAANALSQALAETFRFAPISQKPGQPLILIGPTGAGKSVSVAKLAARMVLAGERPLAITADTTRAGAVAQLSAFTSLLGQALHTADGAAELAALMQTARAQQPVLIDTPGCNPLSSEDLDRTQSLIEAAGAEPILVLPAGMDTLEAIDYAAAFASLGVRRMILTKLDTVRRIGAGLTAAEQLDLAVAEISATPFVGQGLQPLDPTLLASLLLRDPNSAPAAPAFHEAS